MTNSEVIKEAQMAMFKDEIAEAQKAFRREDIPVQVVSMNKTEVFPNLAAAREVYPDLDLFKNGPRFTWAMKGWDFKTDTVMARFETWEAERVLSA